MLVGPLLGFVILTWAYNIADQLVHPSNRVTVGRCNNKVIHPNIPCPKECRIFGQLLIDHALSHALTSTADVLAIYIQQFWRIVKQILTTSGLFARSLAIKDHFRGGEDESDGDEFVDMILLSDEDSDDRIELGSHKDKLDEIADDDEKKDDDDAKDDKDDDDHNDQSLIKTQRTGSSEIRTENMQTPITSPPRSPRTDLSSDKEIVEELMDIIEKANESLKEIVPKLATSATNDPINDNLPKLNNAFRKCDHDENQVIDEDDVIPEEETPELIDEFQNVDKRVPTIYDYERMDATIKDMLRNQFRNAEKYAYHLEQAKKFMENQLNNNRLDFMERIIVMRENDKLDRFSETGFKYLNKNDTEDMYYLCLNNEDNYHENKLLNSPLTFIRSCAIWERVHDFQLGMESYQIKLNLSAPTLTFPAKRIRGLWTWLIYQSFVMQL
uniref:Uncharacterized protein n=1 Tax=Tanacetum cinerariifolium TaxID=118510 RepID=A0A6L2L4S0_TANCI|nr:hypothetical protein [Tanacetum cinerariifolium]